MEGDRSKICPRCGLKYSYIERRRVGNQVYLLAVHYSKEGKRRKVKKCYLGPEDSYLYVSRMHEFTLRGPLDKMRIQKYLDVLLDVIIARRDELDSESRRRIVDKMKRVLELLENEVVSMS